MSTLNFLLRNGFFNGDFFPGRPSEIYSLWESDPRNNITVALQVDKEKSLQFKQEDSTTWETVSSDETRSYHSKNRYIQFFRFDNLTPNTTYEVREGELNRVYKFRTMPESLSRDLKFILTSDTLHSPLLFKAEISKGVIKSHDPDAIIISGDIVHDDGYITSRWDGFWKGWFEHGYNEKGHMIPIIPQYGNHDGGDGTESYTGFWWDRSPREAYLFDSFFPHPGDTGYNLIDVGDYLTIISLDTGHKSNPEGEQKQWLENVLSERTENDRLVLPCLHVSPFPTYYEYDFFREGAVRNGFVDLLSNQNNIYLANTGHNHMFGVTPEIGGVVYVGQGASLGTSLRSELTYTDDEDWLDVAKRVRGVGCLTIKQDKIIFDYRNPDFQKIHSKEINRTN